MPRQWIVWLGDDWGYQTSSAQQLAACLAESHRLLWVNSVGMRTPQLTWRDLQRLWTKGVSTPGLTTRDEVTVASVRLLPLHQWRWARSVNRLIARRATARWCRALKIDEALVVCSVPTAVDLVHALAPRRLIYYCMDDFATLPGVDWHMVEALEAEVIARADVVLVNSPAVGELARFAGRRVTAFPHGVEFQRFNAAAAGPDAEVRALVHDLPRPILGFAGYLDQRIDIELLVKVAQQRPGSLLLVGEVATSLEPLRALPNVLAVGYVPYTEVPRYLAACDVLLAPYVRNSTTAALQPLKILEYLATGAPVVATRLPALEPLASLVDLAPDHATFLRCVQDALANPNRQREARVRYAQEHSWENRAREFERLVDLEAQPGT